MIFSHVSTTQDGLRRLNLPKPRIRVKLKRFLCAAKEIFAIDVSNFPHSTFDKIMNKRRCFATISITTFLIFAITVQPFNAVLAQDIVGGASEDITSGGSVFVFRKKAESSRSRERVKVVKNVQAEEVARRRKRVERRETIARTVQPEKRQTRRIIVPNDKPRTTLEQEAETLAKAGEELFKQNNIEGAELKYRAALKVTPRNARAKYGLSDVFARRGDDAFNAADYKNAALLYKAASGTNEKNVDVLVSLGEAYIKLNEFDNAEDAFDKAREMPNVDETRVTKGLAQTYEKRGDEFFERKDYANSVAYYEKAVVTNTDSFGIYASLGESYESLIDQTEADKNLTAAQKTEKTSSLRVKAIAAYENARRLDKENKLTDVNKSLGTLYFENGDVAKSVEYLEKATKNSKDAEIWNVYGAALFKQNRNAEAQAAFKQASTYNPESAEIHYTLGQVYEVQNLDAEAIAEYQRAIQINPKLTDAYITLAKLYDEKGKYENAAQIYEQAIKISPSSTDAYLGAATAYRQLKQYDKAVDKYFFAVNARKNDADILTEYAFCLGKIRKWDRAIEALKSAIAIKPDAYGYTDLSWAYSNAGKTDLRAGNKPEATRKFTESKTAAQKAVELDTNFAPAQFNLGNALAQLGDGKNAITAFQKAISLRPNWAEAYNNLGFANGIAGDLNAAAAAHRQAIKINENQPDAHANLAVILFKQGNVKDARKEYEKVKKLNPVLAVQLDTYLRGMSSSSPK
ncbi:MAG: tetratricopeptide repeat protein [Pyrinomonadaceae bacterium]|nr:tetratricopeptide repeat protein [Pyrinomonadaceae bacterium]